MTASQPSYFCIANFGDVNPLTYGGAFVCVDRRNTYAPILLILDSQQEGDQTVYTLHEITLERCFMIKNENKITGVGDNVYHTHLCTWFGDAETLQSLADYCGEGLRDFAHSLCSANVLDRAHAYRTVSIYFGAHEFDHYPRKLDEETAMKYCDKFLMQIEASKDWHDGYFNEPWS